jgi:hypothetical protein
MATLTSQRQICTSAAVADRQPARTIGILNPCGGERDHDVSILSAVGGGGLYCGVEPRLKVSMSRLVGCRGTIGRLRLVRGLHRSHRSDQLTDPRDGLGLGAAG